ncbi:MAG: secondary thiamine-phosphate synthase enzyme YjbQ [Candidatus Aenigmarchaeota archaeon]|nr:secondary thiamine-phosphate synthase enzyme YjbQ [Candidatus Aenigmarchaeota archaeon]
MEIFTGKISISTGNDLDIKDITEDVSKIVKDSMIKDGIVHIFSAGSTCGITMMEFEPGLKKDFRTALEKIAPSNIDYEHHKTWNDENGKSHIRSMFIKPELTVPIEDGKPYLGTWQQIVFIDFDVPARERTVLVKVLGK